ncbi:MAG: hypothetical protein ACK53Y_02105, partial [bacterium]
PGGVEPTLDAWLGGRCNDGGVASMARPEWAGACQPECPGPCPLGQRKKCSLENADGRQRLVFANRRR